MKKRIAITGIGAVTTAGLDVPALFRALQQGKRVFGKSERHDLAFDVTVGEVENSGFARHRHPDLDSPTGQLCLTAARECQLDALHRGSGRPEGLALGTSTGGQSMNEQALFALQNGTPPSPFSYRRQGCMGAPSRLVGRDLDIQGPIQTISTACTSSANAIAVGAMWIENGRANRVLAGGGDALCYTTLSSFHILELTGPSPCTPFGENRPGMTLGEGAGFLMLEPMDTVLAEGREPLAELAGYGFSSDAHHMTAPPEDGRGAEMAIRRALASANMQPANVHHINAHGTGTRLNDAAEAAAISRLFAPELPVMSCKGLIGHTLGGAGGIEAVISVISLMHRQAFENLGAETPGADCPLKLVSKGGAPLADDAVVLSNSFAFGGNNCALIFKKPEEAAQ